MESRATKRAILAAVCLCLLLGLLLVIWILSLDGDAAPYDDSHLIRPESDFVPDGQNAFAHYTLAGDSLVFPEDRDKFEAVILGETWDGEFVQNLLTRNATAFKFVEEGNRCERCVLPRITSFMEPVPYLAPFRGIGRLYVLRIRAGIRNGRGDEALGDASALLAFARRIEADPNCLISYLVGLAVRAIAMESVRELLWSGLLDAGQLAQLQRALRENAPSRQAYVLALKSEYEFMANFVDSGRAGEHLDYMYGPSKSGFQAWLQRFETNVFLQPNRTKREIGAIYTEMIDQAANSLADTSFTDVERIARAKREEISKPGGWARYWTPNSVGWRVYGMAMPSMRNVPVAKCRAKVSHTATSLLVALHRYKLAHGALPPNLDALTPEFLSEVPADAFDGKPMRYAPAKGIIYSVGEDLKDSGGSVEVPPDRDHLSPQYRTWSSFEDAVFGIEERIPPAVPAEPCEETNEELVGAP